MPVTVKKVARYDKINEEHEKLIDALLAKIKEHYHPLPAMLQYSINTMPKAANLPTARNPERLYAYMFLVSRQWDVERAYGMVQEVVKYRTENNLDALRMLPSAYAIRGWDEKVVNEFLKVEPRVQPARYDKVCLGVDQYFSCGLHYWDKEGLPVMYMIIGTVDEPGLLKKLKQMATVGQKPDDVIWEYVQHAIGVGEELALFQQHQWENGELAKDGVDASAGSIHSVTIIVDCKGLNYKMLWKPALDLFQSALGRIFRYYPDCVNRIAVVNCPSMVMFAYNIVKGVLDEGVQRKVSFYNPKDTPEALQQIIDKKHIPKFLGGDCQCEGNCVGSHDPDDPTRRENAGGGDDLTADLVTEDIHLRAGKKHEKVFPLKAGETVYWDFAAQSGKEVNFALYFIPATGSRCEQQKFPPKEMEPFVVSKDKPTSGTDSYKATADGTAVLVWDNKDSWLYGKTVQMRVYMQAEDGIHKSEDKLVASLSSGAFVPPPEALQPDTSRSCGGASWRESKVDDDRESHEPAVHNADDQEGW